MRQSASRQLGNRESASRLCLAISDTLKVGFWQRARFLGKMQLLGKSIPGLCRTASLPKLLSFIVKPSVPRFVGRVSSMHATTKLKT
jgi:hypothetical protein